MKAPRRMKPKRPTRRQRLAAARDLEGSATIGAGSGFAKYTREISESRRGKRVRPTLTQEQEELLRRVREAGKGNVPLPLPVDHELQRETVERIYAEYGVTLWPSKG